MGEGEEDDGDDGDGGDGGGWGGWWNTSVEGEEEDDDYFEFNSPG